MSNTTVRDIDYLLEGVARTVHSSDTKRTSAPGVDHRPPATSITTYRPTAPEDVVVDDVLAVGLEDLASSGLLSYRLSVAGLLWCAIPAPVYRVPWQKTGSGVGHVGVAG